METITLQMMGSSIRLNRDEAIEAIIKLAEFVRRKPEGHLGRITQAIMAKEDAQRAKMCDEYKKAALKIPMLVPTSTFFQDDPVTDGLEDR